MAEAAVEAAEGRGCFLLACAQHQNCAQCDYGCERFQNLLLSGDVIHVVPLHV